jgi:cell wall-associated NlpC family hydrolase
MSPVSGIFFSQRAVFRSFGPIIYLLPVEVASLRDIRKNVPSENESRSNDVNDPIARCRKLDSQPNLSPEMQTWLELKGFAKKHWNRRNRTIVAALVVLTTVTGAMGAAANQIAAYQPLAASHGVVVHQTSKMNMLTANAQTLPTTSPVPHLFADTVPVTVTTTASPTTPPPPQDTAEEVLKSTTFTLADAKDLAVGFAASLVGVPYVYGGSTTYSLDCSGYTRLVYAHFGILLPHSVTDQVALGQRIADSQARPGDLVVFNGEGHIGIYAGDDMMYHAPKAGTLVQIGHFDRASTFFVRVTGVSTR